MEIKLLYILKTHIMKKNTFIIKKNFTSKIIEYQSKNDSQG